MEYRICRQILLPLVLLVVAGAVGIAAEPVLRDEALSIAIEFLGEQKADGLRYERLGKVLLTPPFAEVHVLRAPLHAADTNGKQMEATVSVEQATGRVMGYSTPSDYSLAKSKDKEMPKDDELIPQSQALRIAQDVLKKARIPMQDMRLRNCNLSKWHMGNYCLYGICYSKYVTVPETGEIELPVNVSVIVEATTGEVYNYVFKEYPVTVALTAPRITEEQAIEIVKGTDYLQDITEVVGEPRLKVDFDLKDLTVDQKRLRHDAPDRFYDQVEKNLQVLAWEVKVKGTHRFLKETVEMTALVDASTGKVFSHSMPL